MYARVLSPQRRSARVDSLASREHQYARKSGLVVQSLRNLDFYNKSAQTPQNSRGGLGTEFRYQGRMGDA
ncbi:MAG: hypothetical protein RLZZ396_262 [Planctomycetota bacterium]|jgi:hypothetical protein